MPATYDAVVIGSGPNGLAAAITLARAGRSVVVFEAQPFAGGGVASGELTRPGFVHDLCSAVHPLAVASPFFRSLDLARHGLTWIQPEFPLAHPLDDGTAVVLARGVDETAAALGVDGRAYRRLLAPFVRRWQALVDDLLGPLRLPRSPIAAARFGLVGLRGASGVARRRFHGEPGRALFAGQAAHAMLPLDAPGTAAFALILQMLGHACGWPFPRGGAGRLTDALVAALRAHGGDVVLDRRIDTLDELPPARLVLCDLSPRELLRVAGPRLPAGFRRRLSRYRYGMGAFKIDWALDAPIPWTAEACRRAGVVHVGGTLDEIAAAERETAGGGHPERPFVLVAQPTLFDDTRAPAGGHIGWAYCHVPNGSTVDMTGAIERQIERFAPGFTARILARHPTTPADFEARNANLAGGDINAGAQDLGQLFWRPTRRTYRTPLRGLYICSASTPPGGGVHGLCGWHAARAAMRDGF